MAALAGVLCQTTAPAFVVYGGPGRSPTCDPRCIADISIQVPIYVRHQWVAPPDQLTFHSHAIIHNMTKATVRGGRCVPVCRAAVRERASVTWAREGTRCDSPFPHRCARRISRSVPKCAHLLQPGRNRPCSKCQTSAREEWLVAHREQDLLPVGLFQLVLSSRNCWRRSLAEQAAIFVLPR